MSWSPTRRRLRLALPPRPRLDTSRAPQCSSVTVRRTTRRRTCRCLRAIACARRPDASRSCLPTAARCTSTPTPPSTFNRTSSCACSTDGSGSRFRVPTAACRIASIRPRRPSRTIAHRANAGSPCCTARARRSRARRPSRRRRIWVMTTKTMPHCAPASERIRAPTPPVVRVRLQFRILGCVRSLVGSAARRASGRLPGATAGSGPPLCRVLRSLRLVAVRRVIRQRVVSVPVLRRWRPLLLRPLGDAPAVRLDLGRLGSLGLADAPLRPLGLLGRRVVLDPGRSWAPAHGVVGVCPGLRELVSARMEQPAVLPDQPMRRQSRLRSVARVDGGSAAPLRRGLRQRAIRRWEHVRCAHAGAFVSWNSAGRTCAATRSRGPRRRFLGDAPAPSEPRHQTLHTNLGPGASRVGAGPSRVIVGRREFAGRCPAHRRARHQRRPIARGPAWSADEQRRRSGGSAHPQLRGHSAARRDMISRHNHERVSPRGVDGYAAPDRGAVPRDSNVYGAAPSRHPYDR